MRALLGVCTGPGCRPGAPLGTGLLVLVWLCASCVLLAFVLVGASNPPGHISELRNFRADTAF